MMALLCFARVSLMSDVALILYFYTAIMLQFMSMMLLFVQPTCFATLIHYCHIVVKFGHSVPSLLLFLTCVLSCGVRVSLLGACVARPGGERGEFGTPA